MKLKVLLGTLLLLGSTMAAADDEPPVVQVKRLTAETAVKVARATMAACREKGIQIGVTVVDRNGMPQVMLRDTVAPPITIRISRDKAYTAAMFMAATSGMSERAGTPIGRVPGVVMSAGGLPIEAGGIFLGAVGVSGAPSGQVDEECAQAGIDAVIDDLEMM